MGDISNLGMEFGQHVQKVTQELLLAGTPGSLSEMERKIRQALLQIGQFLLGAWIMLQEGPCPPTEIACRCGQKAHYQRKRAGVLFTVLGMVHSALFEPHTHAYCLCSHCRRGTCPLDEKLGLRPGEISAELESLLGMTGALMTFGKGSDLFTRLTLVDTTRRARTKRHETWARR